MDTRLDSLSPRFRPLAVEVLARLVEAHIPVVICNTLRTAEEQQTALATRHSWVAHSKHQNGDAIDLCPYWVYTLHGAAKLQWDATDPVWQKIGAIGEAVGCRWGGHWSTPDLGHLEYHPEPAPAEYPS